MADKQRVLIVKDDENLRRTIVKVLVHEGFLVSEASDGPEGLRMATEDPPAITFLDLELPGMCGDEVLRRLSQRAVPTRVVVVTCKDVETSETVDLMRSGACDVLSRSVSAAEIVAAARRAIEVEPTLDRRRGGTERSVTRFGAAKTVGVKAGGLGLACGFAWVLHHLGVVTDSATLAALVVAVALVLVLPIDRLADVASAWSKRKG